MPAFAVQHNVCDIEFAVGKREVSDESGVDFFCIVAQSRTEHQNAAVLFFVVFVLRFRKRKCHFFRVSAHGAGQRFFSGKIEQRAACCVCNQNDRQHCGKPDEKSFDCLHDVILVYVL